MKRSLTRAPVELCRASKGIGGPKLAFCWEPGACVDRHLRRTSGSRKAQKTLLCSSESSIFKPVKLLASPDCKPSLLWQRLVVELGSPHAQARSAVFTKVHFFTPGFLPCFSTLVIGGSVPAGSWSVFGGSRVPFHWSLDSSVLLLVSLHHPLLRHWLKHCASFRLSIAAVGFTERQLSSAERMP